jgi:hypothetical protein
VKTQLYRHFNAEGELLYVGISLSTINRLGQHKDHSHWFETISRVDIEKFDTKEEALNAEALAIHNEKPKCNIMKPRARQIFDEIARQQEKNYVLERSKMTREELTGRVVKFNIIYTLQEVGAVLGIGTSSVKKLIEDKELGSITLPPRIEGMSHHGTPYKSKQVVSGWQLVSYLESLHGGVF